ncbi:hypothetical protein GOD37_26365 [Sinorhizobium medicae]|nr:hypothetical protein [Sinorhizobium medicae]
MEQSLEYRPGTFFHFDASGMLANNARVGKGLIYSASWIAMIPGLETATTLYAFGNREKEKEAVWESIRASEFAEKPSRDKALFLFTSREDADRTGALWFGSERRQLFELLVPTTSLLHIADARHLDATKSRWEDAARKYWSGELTEDPHREAVLHGAAFVPNWQKL